MSHSIHRLLGVLALLNAFLYASNVPEECQRDRIWNRVGDMVLLQEEWTIEYADQSGRELNFTSESSPINCISNFWYHFNNLQELPVGSSWNFFKRNKHAGYDYGCNWDGGTISINVVEDESCDKSAVDRWKYILVWLIANEESALIEKLNGVVFERVDEKTWTISIWHIGRFFGFDFKYFISEMKSLDYTYGLGLGPNWKQERLRQRKSTIQ